MWNRASRRHIGGRISAVDGASRAPFCGRCVVPTHVGDLAARTVDLLQFAVRRSIAAVTFPSGAGGVAMPRPDMAAALRGAGASRRFVQYGLDVACDNGTQVRAASASRLRLQVAPQVYRDNLQCCFFGDSGATTASVSRVARTMGVDACQKSLVAAPGTIMAATIHA